MRSNPRHAAAALVLLILAWRGMPAAPPATPSTTPATTRAAASSACRDWVEIARDGQTELACGLDGVAAHLRACPPAGPIRRGDRVRIGPGCQTQVRPMDPRRRLALGIKLDVNRASAHALTAVRGIGRATARRIVAGRPYARLVDLERVRGIGPARRRRFTSSLRPSPAPVLWPSSPPPAASTPRTP